MWISLRDKIPDVTEDVGNVGTTPAYVSNGLNPQEKDEAWVAAGKIPVVERMDSKEQPYIWVPYYPYEAQLNVFLCIRRIETRPDSKYVEKKKWRLFDVRKRCCMCHEFHRLGNAQNAFWDMVRAILVWGKPERKQQLQEMMILNQK